RGDYHLGVSKSRFDITPFELIVEGDIRRQLVMDPVRIVSDCFFKVADDRQRSGGDYHCPGGGLRSSGRLGSHETNDVSVIPGDIEGDQCLVPDSRGITPRILAYRQVWVRTVEAPCMEHLDHARDRPRRFEIDSVDPGM